MTENGSETLPQFSDLQLDVFGNLAPDFNYGMRSNPFDLNLAGEGLDFIPLPVVDSSLLHSSTESVQTAALQPMLTNRNADITTQNFTSEVQNVPMHDETSYLPPTLNGASQHLIQHYLEVMKGYSKVDDRPKNESNLFISAFSESLCFPPLLYAILAFSASHLSIQDPSYTTQADEFSRLAATSFDSFRQDYDTEVEGLLSALFVRVKRVHVMAESMDSFLGLMAIATEIISTESGEKALQNPSTLARRILLRLAILDARAGCYRLGGGTLVSRLRQIPSLSFLFDFNAPLDLSRGDVINLLRADILRMRVGELDTRIQKQAESQHVLLPQVRMDEITALYDDIQREIDRWELYLADRNRSPIARTCVKEEVLDSPTYGCYAVLSALHSAMLYLYNTFVRSPG